MGTRQDSTSASLHASYAPEMTGKKKKPEGDDVEFGQSGGDLNVDSSYKFQQRAGGQSIVGALNGCLFLYALALTVLLPMTVIVCLKLAPVLSPQCRPWNGSDELDAAGSKTWPDSDPNSAPYPTESKRELVSFTCVVGFHCFARGLSADGSSSVVSKRDIIISHACR